MPLTIFQTTPAPQWEGYNKFISFFANFLQCYKTLLETSKSFEKRNETKTKKKYS